MIFGISRAGLVLDVAASDGEHVGMDDPCKVPNQNVRGHTGKTAVIDDMRHAAIGFRVKSGWAATVLVAGSISAPQVLDRRRIELSGPAVPGSTQPYHAAMGKLQTDEAKVERLRKVIVRAAGQSFAELLRAYRDEGHSVTAVSLIVGSDIDPAKIANPHIRAHALEGRLFRTVLEDAARAAGLPCSVIVERDLYRRAVAGLNQNESELKTRLTHLGRALAGSWRADDKAACLAAWMALAN